MSEKSIRNKSPRPRVGLINTDGHSLSKLGEHRSADTLVAYFTKWSASETDILVLDSVPWEPVSLVVRGCHVLSRASTVGPGYYEWEQRASTERELHINSAAGYEAFQGCCEQLADAVAQSDPVDTIEVAPNLAYRSLISTWVGNPVVALVDLDPSLHGAPRFGIIVPREADLGSWYTAFLQFLHEVVKESVPMAPPRLSDPKAWATPEELTLHDELEHEANALEAMRQRRVDLESKLNATQSATDQAGQRRMLFDDGDSLVAAVIDCLRDLGFEVEDVDGTIPEGEPKCEDLRVRDPKHDPNWVAIVEVKGYSKGVKTSDARQINEQSRLYLKNQGEHDVWWVVNPYRTVDPGCRIPPSKHVAQHAENIGAVLIPTTELYLAWRDCQLGYLDAAEGRALLIGSSSGLWVRSGEAGAMTGGVE